MSLPRHLACATELNVPARALVGLARRAAPAERIDLHLGLVKVGRVGAPKPAVLHVEPVVGGAHGVPARGLVHVADVVDLHMDGTYGGRR